MRAVVMICCVLVILPTLGGCGVPGLFFQLTVEKLVEKECSKDQQKKNGGAECPK